MAVIAKGAVSHRRIDIPGQRSAALGFKRIKFAHQATGGEGCISLTALTAPAGYLSSGFVQPSAAALSSCDIFAFRNNLTLISSLKGILTDFGSTGDVGDYVVTNPTTITLTGWTLQASEVITGIFDRAPLSGLIVADINARPITGVLPAGATDFNTGWKWDVNKWPDQQLGAVIVVDNGLIQARCIGNNPANEGNYVEVDPGAAVGNVIRFANTDIVDHNIMIIPTLGMAIAPSYALSSQYENLQGQVNNIIGALVSELGGSASDYGTAPTYQDLASFGNRVLALEGYTSGLSTNDFTIRANEQRNVDTSARVVNVTLPASPTAGVTKCVIIDAFKCFATNNCVLQGNGSTIESSGAAFALHDAAKVKYELLYVGAAVGWRVY